MGCRWHAEVHRDRTAYLQLDCTRLAYQGAFEWCLSPKERYHLALLVSSSRRLCAPGTLAGGSEFVEAELLTKLAQLLIEQGSSPCAPVKRDLHANFRDSSEVVFFFERALNLPLGRYI